MKRRKDSGYALLLVFLMGAIIAISLYMEVPRLAFESQRQKEQLLIARGEQYKRAIQMFMKANNRWPAKLEELENTNNRRFLRKRFLDPMTGKEEWRFIHVQNGMLVDSLLSKPKGGQAATGSVSGLVGEIPISAADPTGAQQGVNVAMRKRASDGMTPGIGGNGTTTQPLDPNNPQDQIALQNQQAQLNLQNQMNPTAQPYPGMQPVPGQPGTGQPVTPGQMIPPGASYPPGVIPGQPGAFPGQVQQYPGQPAQYPGQPVQYPGQVQQYPGQPVQYPGQVQQYPGQPAQYPGQPQQYPGQIQQFPGQPVNSQTGGVSPYPITPGANGAPPGFAQPGLNPQPGSNQATQMIQQILTSPRPGGMPGNTNPQMVGGGIAGVASNLDADAIMIYQDRTNYKEWEFVYDPTKVKQVPNPLQGALGTPASQMGSMPGADQPTQTGGKSPILGPPGQIPTGIGQPPPGMIR